MVRSLPLAEPLDIFVGADRTLNIPLYGDDGSLLSVTGKTAEFKLYKAVPRRARKAWTGNALLSKTSAAGEIALTDGQAAVTIGDTDLDGKSGAHWYVVLITTTSGGAVRHAAEGEIFLRRAPA